MAKSGEKCEIWLASLSLTIRSEIPICLRFNKMRNAMSYGLHGVKSPFDWPQDVSYSLDRTEYVQR